MSPLLDRLRKISRCTLGQRFRRLRDATQGVAAVEFALVLPVMITIYLGMSEMTFYVNTDRKFAMLSRTLADLTGRAPSVNSTEMDTIFSAATSVMAPYRSDQAKMVISSIVVKETGQKDAGGKPILEGTVCWSAAKGPGATALAKGTKVTIPEGFATANSSFVRANILQKVTGSSSITLTEQTPWPVRNVKEIVWSGSPACL
jgi:Flp pilus assembly protein TadG